MPTVAITDTETNPSSSVTYGGGKRETTLTETNPSSSVAYGGGKRETTLTEINPTFWGGGGGGWRIFVETENNPAYKLLKDTQTMGRSKGLDFRGKGFRI